MGMHGDVTLREFRDQPTLTWDVNTSADEMSRKCSEESQFTQKRKT
jgi:hypothetical protein